MMKPSKEKNPPSRRLLLMRHAKSDWSTAAGSDFDRPLNRRGERDAPRVGRWLRENDLTPDWIVSSPALRAKETILLVCQELGFKKSAIHWEPGVYAAVPRTLLKVLAKCPPDKRLVMVVGHNPGLEELLAYLVTESALPLVEKRMPTAAIACVKLPDDWSALRRGIGRLEMLMSPKELNL